MSNGVWVAINAMNKKFDALKADLESRDDIINQLQAELKASNERCESLTEDLHAVNNRLKELSENDYVYQDDITDFASISSVVELANSFSGYQEITLTVEDLKAFKETVSELRNEIPERIQPLSVAIDDVNNRMNSTDERTEEIYTEVNQAITAACDELRIESRELRTELDSNISTLKDLVGESASNIETLLDTERERTDEMIDKVACGLDLKIDNNIKDMNDNITGVKSTLCKLPKNFILNNTGDLVSVDSSGDITVIGNIKNPENPENSGKPDKQIIQEKKERFTNWFKKQEKDAKLDTMKLANIYGVSQQTIYRWIRTCERQ